MWARTLAFLRVNQKSWLLPIVLTLLVIGLLLAYSQGRAIAPFIYTRF